MYHYGNSYLHGFRGQIDPIKPQNNENSTANNTKNSISQNNEIQHVVPDYNVSVPTGYTKLGIKELSNGQKIHCYKLNNGQKVYIAPKESAKTILNTYVNTGAMNEKDEERGISHFCEHMAFNGTKGTDGYEKLGIGDVFRKVDEMGGYTNASTDFAETNYTISIPQFGEDDFETIVKMQSSMMNNLEMSDEMVKKEQGPVTSEINMYGDMSANTARNEAIKNLYNIKTTSSDAVAGRVENILNLDGKKVTDYYKNNYYPANMTTVVTGDVNPDEAIEIISKHFRGENPPKQDRRFEQFEPLEKTVRKDIISNKAVTTSGVVCFNGPANDDDKGNMVIDAVNYYLFNKKNSKTEKDLENYNIDVIAEKNKIGTRHSDGTLIGIEYDSTEENSEKALKSIFNNLANFKAPTDEELDTIKTALKMRYENSYEDMEDLNMMLGRSSLVGGIDGCVDALKIIDSITPQDMADAVYKYYDINKASVAVVHPEKADINTITKNYNDAKSVSFTGKINNSKEKRPLKTENIEHYTLPNNCDVAVMESNKDIAHYEMNITTVTPANTKPGVSAVLTAMLGRGSKKQQNLIDKNNISLFTKADMQGISYEAELPAKNLAVSLDLMKELAIDSKFSDEDFNKAKQEVKNNLAMLQPDAFDIIRGTLYPDSPFGYSIKDTIENIDNVTIEDVRGLCKYIMDNGSMTVAVSMPTGKYPNSKNILDSKLAELKEFKPNKPRTFNDYVPIEKSVVVTDNTNNSQADVMQVYKFKNNQTPKERVSLKLMNSILSSGDETGLFNNLREKQKLAYRVNSTLDISPSMSSSVLICEILTTTDSPDYKSYDNVQKSITGFHNQINKMMEGEFTDKELEAAKLKYKQALLESSDGQANLVGTMSDALNTEGGLEDINTLYKTIDDITKEDIQNSAKEVFSTKPVYSIRASKATIDANKPFFESLEQTD